MKNKGKTMEIKGKAREHPGKNQGITGENPVKKTIEKQCKNKGKTR